MNSPALTFRPVPGIPEIEPGVDLAAVLAGCIDTAGLQVVDGDVIAVAQKIVSKAEGRFVDLRDIAPSEQALALEYSKEKDPRLAELILRESNRIVRDTPIVLIVEHRSGIVLANAGIDRSNVRGDDQTALAVARRCGRIRRNPQKNVSSITSVNQSAY